MKPTIPLGRIAGIPLGAHWSVLVTVALMAYLLAGSLPTVAPHYSLAVYWAVGAGAAVVFFGSLTGHELSHAVAAKRFGLRVRRITLWLLGGTTQMEDAPATPRAEGLVALAGPVSSLLFAGVFFLAGYLAAILHAGALFVAVLVWLAAVNVLLGVFNLLPGAPLDGGRVLRALLWWRSGDRARANRAAASTGQALGVGLIAAGVFWLVATGDISGLWVVLLGWFLVTAAAAERAGGPSLGQLARFRIAGVMTRDPVSVPGWWTVAALIDAMIERPPVHRVFPVVGFDGRPTGVVSLTELARVPDAERLTTRVADAGRPVERVTVTTPQVVLTDLVRGWRPRSAADVVLVLGDDHELVGMVTAADIARAVELATLFGDRTQPSATGRIRRPA
jgi:Zn-dependent protease